MPRLSDWHEESWKKPVRRAAAAAAAGQHCGPGLSLLARAAERQQQRADFEQLYREAKPCAGCPHARQLAPDDDAMAGRR